MIATSCATPAGLDGFETAEVDVDGQQITVAVASTSAQRSQGLQDVDTLPPGLEGMLFVFDGPTSTTFHMRNVAFPLDVWYFDPDRRLIGSATMETCPKGNCTSYGTPGEIMWALETPAGDWEFAPGVLLSNVE